MQKTKLFLLIFSLLAGIFLLVFLTLGSQMEEFSGSQTRMGGFLESEFGWNQPQMFFSKRERMADAKSLADYDQAYDILIIGDSFSHDKEKGWQNYLIDRYGLSALFMHVDHFSMAALLKHESFQRNPPSLLIWSSNEGEVISRLKRLARTQRNSNDNDSHVTLDWQVKEKIQLHPRTRKKEASFLRRLAITGDYMFKVVIRNLFWEEITGVVVTDSGCIRCFSNKQSGRYLSFSGDKIGFNPKGVAEAAKILIALKKAVEANGQTRFLSLIFPNKIGVYGDSTGGPTGERLSGSAIVSPETSGVDLLPLFKTALNKKSPLIDLYLPNDHHTGWAGYQITAMAVAQALNLADLDIVAPSAHK